mmetsp:Transcript_20285/g.29978  ORF Transcript_20285/g.29978 Transcript_20285/m.29978 type:complete len:93 (+) Transcript_20285:96-374(+)|eukprot:CAMPEP_0171464184 /NCGR_PEP_ID=MMETSP0945-20130129/7583_1 /TAXON_ID=109269 /ORGANISM="Vaucheria litorea, Strain CCMP2940" /LENGTH=92 /DNA_ID=CAMNT_0011991179 /DNA_START=94 /DNA_END=372 /DNA_ORIENTATION=+
MPKAADGKPKRGLSAFMFFSNELRPKLLKENPEMKFGEVGKAIGAKWRELSDKEKEPYAKKAEEDKKRYTEEMKDYKPPVVEKKKRPSRARK